MTPNEVIQLLRLIRAYAPNFAIDEGTPAAWASLLGDVPAADANAAVREHFANGGPWIGVADIRRHVATRRGLLPPDVETAYAQAVTFNRWLSRRAGPEPPIHPAAIEAARLIRWPAFEAADGGHRRFRDAYRAIAERATQRTLTGNITELAAAVDAPKALPAGSGAEPTAEPEPDVGDERIAAVHTAVTRVSVTRALTPVRPDYAAPSEIEKRRWAEALSEWAEQNGHPIGTEEAS